MVFIVERGASPLYFSFSRVSSLSSDSIYFPYLLSSTSFRLSSPSRSRFQSCLYLFQSLYFYEFREQKRLYSTSWPVGASFCSFCLCRSALKLFEGFSKEFASRWRFIIFLAAGFPRRNALTLSVYEKLGYNFQTTIKLRGLLISFPTSFPAQSCVCSPSAVQFLWLLLNKVFYVFGLPFNPPAIPFIPSSLLFPILTCSPRRRVLYYLPPSPRRLCRLNRTNTEEKSLKHAAKCTSRASFNRYLSGGGTFSTRQTHCCASRMFFSIFPPVRLPSLYSFPPEPLCSIWYRVKVLYIRSESR